MARKGDGRSSLYIQLIQKICKENKDRLNSARLKISLSKIGMKYPILEKLKINSELEFTSDKAMGEDGYLTERGLIPLGAGELKAVQDDVKNLKRLEM